MSRQQEHMSAEQYRQEMGLAPGVAVPAEPKIRKAILEMTKPEREYAHHLEHEKLAGRVVAYWPQPFALRLPGWRQTYRPDFIVQWSPSCLVHGLAVLEIVEIKTLWKIGRVGWQPDAREKFKTAAGIYTSFAWVCRWKDHHDCWQEERFNG